MSPHPRPISRCEHLFQVAGQSFHLWFTGRGTDHHWVCDACAKAYPDLPELFPISDSTVESAYSPGGILGKPAFPERDIGLRIEIERFPSPFAEALVTPWLNIQPDLTSPGRWFVLLRSGEIAVFHPREQSFRILFQLDPGFVPDEETAFHLDTSSSYGALCQCNARLACVFDMRTGAVTRRIERGDYYPEHCRFPLAFFADSSGRPLMVAATDWNILDIFDPSDGRILTTRTLEAQGGNPERQALDYFHASLSVSPDGRWIADYGWVWHPFGDIRTWNLLDWLESNPWESESGPSLGSTAIRAYYWDGPLCWVNETTLAIWGWGDDDELLLPAVCFYDVAAREERGWFPGPEAQRLDHFSVKHRPPTLFFDDYLFCVHEAHGFAVWDIADGARLLHEPSLTPRHYHPGSKEFISISGETVILTRMAK